MRYRCIAVFLAGFFLAAGIFLTHPRHSSAEAARPDVDIAMRNTGTRNILEASVKFAKENLTWQMLLPDGCKTYSSYKKPIPLKATVRVKIENEPAFEQVVSLRGWNSIPGAAAVKIYFDVRTDMKKILVSFLYLNEKNQMIDFRAAPSGASPGLAK